MPMNKTQLAQEIKTAMEAVLGTTLPGSPDQYLEAFSDAIIQHIIDNAVTSTQITSGSSSGTWTGTIIS